MAICISFGKWGGVYACKGWKSFRLCLGILSITLMYQDIDTWLGVLVDAAGIGRNRE